MWKRSVALGDLGLGETWGFYILWKLDSTHTRTPTPRLSLCTSGEGCDLETFCK